MTAVEEFKESVSRETLQRLEHYVELLLKWNKSINLIASGEQERVWERHILDSAQVFNHFPGHSGTWFDFGSGGGLPGIVCATLSKGAERDIQFHAVESDHRKAVFLNQVVIALDLSVSVSKSRVEHFSEGIADVISARALASLPKLLGLCRTHMNDQTILLFPKGRKAESELTEARESWHMKVHRIQSLTDPDGVILKLTGVHPRT